MLTSVALQGDEAFSCEVCKQRTDATKHMRIHRLPLVLMLHIKRFKFAGQTWEKLTSNVTYPLKVAKAGCMSCLSCSCLSSDVRQLHISATCSWTCASRILLAVALPTAACVLPDPLLFFWGLITGKHASKAVTAFMAGSSQACVHCQACCSIHQG